jgi:hypothetical protein
LAYLILACSREKNTTNLLSQSTPDIFSLTINLPAKSAISQPKREVKYQQPDVEKKRTEYMMAQCA